MYYEPLSVSELCASGDARESKKRDPATDLMATVGTWRERPLAVALVSSRHRLGACTPVHCRGATFRELA